MKVVSCQNPLSKQITRSLSSPRLQIAAVHTSGTDSSSSMATVSPRLGAGAGTPSVHRPVMLVGWGFAGRMSLVGIEARGAVAVVGMLPVVGLVPGPIGLTEPRKMGLSVLGMEPLVAFGVRGIGRDCCP